MMIPTGRHSLAVSDDGSYSNVSDDTADSDPDKSDEAAAAEGGGHAQSQAGTLVRCCEGLRRMCTLKKAQCTAAAAGKPMSSVSLPSKADLDSKM